MDNNTVNHIEIVEETPSKTLETPLKSLIKQIFKHLLIYSAIFIAIIAVFVISSELITMVKQVNPEFLPMITSSKSFGFWLYSSCNCWNHYFLQKTTNKC